MENHNDKPLSQQYDLSYVRRSAWPHSLVRWLSLVVVMLIAGYFIFAGFTHDRRAYTSGPMTHAHAMFGDDCAQCHQPDPDSTGFWLPAQDEACLRCHVAEAHHPFEAVHAGSTMRVSDRLGRIPVAIDCASCHVEHQGADHDLTMVPDAACVRCHGQLEEARAELEQLHESRARRIDYYNQPEPETPTGNQDAQPTDAAEGTP